MNHILKNSVFEQNNIVAAKGTFSFKNAEHRTFIISDNYRIRLSIISPHSATLQLVNDQNEPVDFPGGFRIRDTLYNDDLVQVTQYNDGLVQGGFYVVSWMSNYEISVNNNIIAKIYNQRQFAIFKTKENAVGEYIADELAVQI